MEQASAAPQRVAIIGAGRVGRVLAHALGPHAIVVTRMDPDPRATASHADIVVLCVPDDAISDVIARFADGPPLACVLTVSGATPLVELAPLAATVGRMHPLVALTEASSPQHLVGAIAAIGGTDDIATHAARQLASQLGLEPFELAEEDRGIWHAAATIAANYSVTLIAAARDLAVQAGMSQERALAVMSDLALGAIQRAGAESPEVALTGAISRGDAHTVALHREQLAARAPELAVAYSAMGQLTLELAHRSGRIPDLSDIRSLREALA